jgi:Concanavalin A-like lectin/glucanases superfamily/PEP-CTERM motif
MKKTGLFLASIAASASVPASAAVIGDFRLNGNLTNSAGGALSIANNGGSLGATGITFGSNQGPTISGFSSPANYSVETAFSFATIGGYRKIIDFLDRSSDTGLYVLSGFLNFYNLTTSGSAPFVANQMNSLVFTRDAGGNSVGYVNGTALIAFNNAGLTNVTSFLHLFRDDFATGQGEASPGFVDYIRVYDTALTGSEVAGLTPPGGVPEPAAWALMIAGFGLVGSVMRRRQSVRVTYA